MLPIYNVNGGLPITPLFDPFERRPFFRKKFVRYGILGMANTANQLVFGDLIPTWEPPSPCTYERGQLFSFDSCPESHDVAFRYLFAENSFNLTELHELSQFLGFPAECHLPNRAVVGGELALGVYLYNLAVTT